MNLIQTFEEEYETRLPTHKEVCPTCRGKGSRVNPAIDGNGITEQDRLDWADDDFMEDYMRGVYDIRCDECDGKNVVDVVDEDRLSPELKKEWTEWVQSHYETEAIYAMERRMGA